MVFSLFAKRQRRPSQSNPARKLFARTPNAVEPFQVSPWFAAARNLDDGAPLNDELVDGIHSEIRVRMIEAGVESSWPSIRFSDMRVRRESLPDWWTQNGNLMLAGPNANVEIVAPPLGMPLPVDSLLILGAGVSLRQVYLSRSGGIVAVGDNCYLHAVAVAVSNRSSVLIGEDTNATGSCMIDARNGGAIIAGADGMWAWGISMMTDDGHTIRNLATGERANVFGGRIVIERHVWLCTDVAVLADCRIGADTVVGLRSIVKNSVLPPNSVCVGQPARPVRTGMTWSREDVL